MADKTNPEKTTGCFNPKQQEKPKNIKSVSQTRASRSTKGKKTSCKSTFPCESPKTKPKRKQNSRVRSIQDAYAISKLLSDSPVSQNINQGQFILSSHSFLDEGRNSFARKSTTTRIDMNAGIAKNKGILSRANSKIRICDN